MYYYAHHLGKNKNQRDKYKDHEYYSEAVDLEKWDQASFDPNLKVCHWKTLLMVKKNIFKKTIFFL